MIRIGKRFTQHLCKNIFLQGGIGKTTEKSTKKKRPLSDPPRYCIRSLKIHKMPPDGFLWWGLVSHGDMIPYFGCTIFAGLEMGTLVARQFLPTLKIFFPKKKKKKKSHELWHQIHPGTPWF